MAVAAGDLDHEISIQSRDEIGVLGSALNVMVTTLKDKIEQAHQFGQEARLESERAKQAAQEANHAMRAAESARGEGMRQAADSLHAVVERLGQVSDHLSDLISMADLGAQTQLSRVAETATAITQMNSSVLEIARNAEKPRRANPAGRDSKPRKARRRSVKW